MTVVCICSEPVSGVPGVQGLEPARRGAIAMAPLLLPTKMAPVQGCGTQAGHQPYVSWQHTGMCTQWDFEVSDIHVLALLLGQEFFIYWFTKPPTLNFGKLEKI